MYSASSATVACAGVPSFFGAVAEPATCLIILSTYLVRTIFFSSKSSALDQFASLVVSYPVNPAIVNVILDCQSISLPHFERSLSSFATSVAASSLSTFMLSSPVFEISTSTVWYFPSL